MNASNLDGVLERFSGQGSTMQISNMMSPTAEPDEKFVYEGELERVWLEGDDLCARFLWIAKRDVAEGCWYLLTDPKLLDYRVGLMLYQAGAAADDGRYSLFPAAPLHDEQILLVAHDYHGPTGRVPLSRSEVRESA